MADDEIILSELSDDELVQQMHDDLYDGLKEEIEEGTNILLERGWMPYKVLTEALVEGMRIVGEDFRDGILFVPEVLLSANAMKAGMFILRPLLAATGAPKQGKMVIGTVKGDIHDIGKNLVGMMMEGAGFDVIDLGINNPVEKYLDAIEEHQPDIIGMSALLTTTMPYMKVVIDTMKEKGIRDDYVVLVGGAPLNEEFGKAVGADAYCRDAAVAVETAKDFMKRKHNRARLGLTTTEGRASRRGRFDPDLELRGVPGLAGPCPAMALRRAFDILADAANGVGACGKRQRAGEDGNGARRDSFMDGVSLVLIDLPPRNPGGTGRMSAPQTQRWQKRKAAGHRLRHDRARDPGGQRAARPRSSRTDLPAGRLPLLSRPHRARHGQGDRRGQGRRLRAHLRRLCRLRHRRPARPRLREARRRAHRRPALLRLLPGHATPTRRSATTT